ncbi:MAG: hypothetical protein GY862_15940 [Gammaproteobacteria bacterium]|nr:hypothetical protein [Gammaproteobacteria bacterium]
MSGHRITLEIPENLYQRLQHFAELASRPLENLVLQSITDNMPPLPEDLPPDMQPELSALEQLNDEALWKKARAVVGDKQQTRYNRLLKKQRDDPLSQSEQDELEYLFQQSEQHMLRKAYAYALLKWRGHRLPPLSQLPALVQ